MKQIKFVLSVVFIGALVAVCGFGDALAADNLVPNASFEMPGAAGLPADWNKLKTGTNDAVFVYPAAGFAGSGINTAISKFTSGLAEWYFNEVPVVAGQRYSYSEMYKSGGLTSVRARYKMPGGVYQYITLGSPAAAANWTRLNYNFIVPLMAQAVTIMHGLRGAGNLFVDDANLVATDTQRPVVRITSPLANQPVSGTVKFAATASDNVAVAGVQFILDGVRYGAEDTVAPYEIDWNSTGARIGSHYVRATTKDTSGNTANSTPIYFTVSGSKPDTTAPAVAIASPAAGSTLTGDVILQASATDPVVVGAVTSGVKQVDFMIDGSLAGTATGAAPYKITYSIGKLTSGSHTIGARAVDNAGNTGMSPTISINVAQQDDDGGGDANNLVPNPLLETVDPADPSKPSSWSFGSWSSAGMTVVASYPVAGVSGSAVRTEITSYGADGDAKWYFEPQAIIAGTKYDVFDRYRSNIASRVSAWFVMSDGSNKYIELSPAAAATTWTTYDDFVIAPAGAAKISVMHLIDGVGWLETDNYSVTAAPPSSNFIFNGDLEIQSPANSALPSHWYKAAWGNNSAILSYSSGIGRNGSYGAKVEMSNYKDGDVRWYSDNIAVTPGEYYKFSVWYKSNIDTRVVAHYVYNDKTDHYVDLRGAMVAGAWTLYSDYVQVPANAKTMSVYQLVASNGWLITDDYSLVKTTLSGFNSPAITLTFDDGWEDNVSTVLPVLQNYGFKANFYFATQFLKDNALAGTAAVKAVAAAGHEIGSHSVTHPFLTTATASVLAYELVYSKQYLENIVGIGKVKSFASPYGAYNQAVINAIKANYQSHRTVDSGYNIPDGFDPYRLKVQNMLVQTTLAEYQGWVNEAKAKNLWLVIVYHRVASSNLGDYDTPLADFAPQMEIIKNSGIAVKPMSQALAGIGL